MSAEFVHLHLHTEYSLLDGFCRLKPLVARAAEMQFPAMAVTDHGVMYAAVDFHEMARAANIKPIIGCEVYVATRTRFDRQPRLDDKQHTLVLLAQNETGYRNLVKIVSQASIEGYYYKPRCDKDLLAQHNEGLIALSGPAAGCGLGEVPFLARNGEDEKAMAAAAIYRDIFGPERYCIEMLDHGLPAQHRANPVLIKIARELGLKLVATNDVHYLHSGDADAREILLCVQKGTNINDPKRTPLGNQHYLKSAEEMAAVFKDLPEAVSNTLRVAEMIDFKIETGHIHLPDFPVPDGYTVESYLEKLCEEGLELRFGTRDVQADVRARLNYELDVIKKMGFPAYFLIIWDFIKWAREHDIPVGPGRGSAAGALVAYLLRITELNPMEHALLFERFLNPGRKSMPDVDTDFCQDRREEVMKYVNEFYGRERVSQIITFGRLKAKASVRDVGRALAIPLPEVDRIAKMIPGGPNVTLGQALEIPELKQLYEGNDTARRVVDLARRLEGVARNASIHACGVIISKQPLMEIAPLQKMPGGDEVVVQFEMKTVDLIGLLKMDFLGLRNLTIINDALDFIRRTRGEEIDLTTLSTEDEPTFKLLQEARTSGVFQVESAGMRRYLRALKPERFADIVAMVALYRPGPIQGGVVDRYINCKHGREPVVYPHPDTEPILKETYGFMIYQEQVMQISNVLARFTLAEADDLRKAMGKKNPAVMAKQREKFVNGCVANEIDAKLAGDIFDLMEKFAGYGFNKSHSAAYALVTYQTAWLKANYGVEYMCALLTSVMSNSEKVSFFVKECRALELKVLPPCVNHSRWKFEVERLEEGGWGIRFGLGAIKNVGESAVAAIVAEREANGTFRGLPDLCRRVDQKQLNKRVLECLVVAGAMDALGGTRAQHLTVLDDCIEYGQLLQKDANAGQASLFDGGGEEATEPELPLVADYEKSEMLAAEKELLGIHMSDSPLTEFAHILGKAPFVSIQGLDDIKPGEKVCIGGMVTSMRRILTKTKNTMAFLEVEDMTGSIEVTLLPKDYERCGSKIELNQIVQVKGKLEMRQARGGQKDDAEESEGEEPVEEMKVLGEDISALQNLNRFYQAVQEAGGESKRLPAPKELPRANKPVEVAPVTAPPKHFYLQVGDMSDWSSRNDDRHEAAPGEGGTPKPRFTEPANGHAPQPPVQAPAWPPERDGVHVKVSLTQRARLPELKSLLLQSRGEAVVFLHLESPEGRTVLSLGPDFSVAPSQEFLTVAENLLGRGAIHIEPAKGKS